MPKKSNRSFVELKFKQSLLAVLCSLSVAAMAAEENDKEVEIDEILITGRQQALQNAAELKRNAEASIDSIVADDAGMLPDASITEVLQRISGVSIVRFASLANPDAFSAEGSGVQVRGLSGVASRLNGREVFSANSGRGLSWSDVTPELMAGVDVYKSATADLIEGGTGGTIDLRTKMPFDSDGFKASLTSSATYADLSEELTPSGSFLVSNRWDTQIGEFGALLDLSASEYKQRADFIRMEPFYATAISDGNGGYEDKFIPGGYDYGTTNYERNRKGGYLGLQWAPNEDLTISQTVFYSEYDDQSTSSGLFVVSENLTVDPSVSQFDKNDALIKTSNIFLRDNTTFGPQANQTLTSGGNTGVSAGTSETRDITTSFKWNPTESWTFKGAFQMVDSTATRSNYDVFPGVPFPSTFALDLTGDLPQVRLANSSLNAFANPSLYSWEATMDHIEDNEGDLRAGNIDADYVISEEGFFRSAQVGVRYAERTEIDNNSGYNWTALGQGWNGSPKTYFSDAREGDVESHAFDHFFRGQTNLPANTLMPSLSMVERRDVVGDHTAYGGLPVEPIGFNELGLDRLRQETDNTAVYGLVRFASDQGIAGVAFKGNLGARYVRIKNISTGFYQQTDTAPFRLVDDPNAPVYRLAATAEIRNGGATFDKVLPSINLSLEPSDEVKIRLGYDVTLDQPSFSALKATGSLSIDSETIQPVDPDTGAPVGSSYRVLNNFRTSSGNPELKPVISHNSNLSFEWYPNKTTSAHLSLFHKSIDNWITYGEAVYQLPVTYLEPITQTVIENVQADNVSNSDKNAKVKGFEMGGRTFFNTLPSPWDGLGIEANYTHINSKNPGDLYRDIYGIEHTDAPLIGLSKNNFNFTLMYEKGPVSLRAAYSWRSKYLMSTNSNGTNGDYEYRAVPGADPELIDISLPIYSDDFGQLDMGGSYNFTDNLTISLQLSNVTDEIPVTLQGGYENGALLPRSWFLYDRRAELIVRYNF